MTAEEILAAAHAAIFRDEVVTELPPILRDVVGLRNEAQRTRAGIIAVLDAIREPTHEMIASVSDYAAGPRPELHGYAWDLEREGIFNTWTAMIDALKAEILGLPGKEGGL